MKTFVIAEAGVNHNNKLNLAIKLINNAKKSGANAVKFQVFKTENYVKKNAPLASYQKKNSRENNQFDLIKKLELNEKKLNKILNHCKKKKILFLASPFDEWGINFLKKKRISIIKIPSGEINNYPYLEKIGALNKKIILSTGMSNLKEIKFAINLLVSKGTKRKNITLLHCNTEYPTPLKDMNLNVLYTLKNFFRLNVGLSDHSCSIIIPSIAVTMGAKIIEKHLTLDKKMKGPDHKASLEPHEFKLMIKYIKDTESAFGDFKKKVTRSEFKNIKIARKAIVAKKKIKKGEKFTNENIIGKRPAKGRSISNWYNILGTVAKKNYEIDDFI